MNRTQTIKKSLALATLLSGLVGSAAAVPLINGGFVALPGTSAAIDPQLVGAVVAERSDGFSFAAYGGMVTGVVHSRVVRSALDGSLDFYWQVINDGVSAGAIQELRLGDFVAPEYNANWRLDGAGDEGPGTGHYFAGPLGVSVHFQFFATSAAEPGAGLGPGQASKWMFLDTTANYFGTTAFLDLPAMNYVSGSDRITTFAPSAIPEPGSWLLMGLGLATVATRLRRPR